MASLLYGLAGKLLRELCSPAFKNYVGKPWGFGTEEEFEKLKNTLSSIEAVLLDADEKQRTNHQIRDWLVKIKLVFYDVEDVLQEVTTEALKRQVMTKNKRAKKVHNFFSSSNQVKYRLKMGRKVKFVRESLDAIASDHNRFNFSKRQEEMHVTRSTRQTHSFVPIENVIGRCEDKKYVTELLVEPNDEKNVSIISIIGIGGVGKTTLAQSLYSSEEVKARFELMMWVCVSEVFDVKQICEKIIESATKNRCDGLQMDGVKNNLKKAIDGRKYLLVLDDVWNESPLEWMELEILLTGGAKGSKILITARAALVARATKSDATHVLKGLSDEESWTLFKQVVFKQGAEPESSIIVGIGKEVGKICVGVPLAIKIIGSMLVLKEKEVDWLNFKKNDLPMITQVREGRIVDILKLSYDNLSAPLKRCFVYCAIYPKDYEIEKEALIGMWMAQGLIQSDDTIRSLEDVGQQYFTDLLDRSLFEVHDKYDYCGTFVECYKMHDLIHDLAQSLGGNEYYNIHPIMNCTDKTTRHAWVARHATTNFLQTKNLRTLVVTCRGIVSEGHAISEIKSISEKMRVLVLRRLNLMSVPPLVDGLRHLNYLDLSNNDFDLLPESICSLYNLQTLILTYCENLKELPKKTRNLVSLRHLDIHGCDEVSRMPRGLGELTDLRTLSKFVLGIEGSNCCELGELKSLVNLRGKLLLEIRRGSNIVKCGRGQSCGYLYPLTHLEFVEHLELHVVNDDEIVDEEDKEELVVLEYLKPHPNLQKLNISHAGDKMFPSWMDKVNIGISLPNIITLTIRFCNWKHLPPFGLLPSLCELNLGCTHGIEYMYDEEREEEEYWNNNNYRSTPKSAYPLLFPTLKTLCLSSMPQLSSLVGPTATSRLKKDYSSRHFPVLEKLLIRDCALMMVADGKQLQSLTSLREVTIEHSLTETLPAVWLQYLPHLQVLELDHCDNIVSLPEWMGNLTSLQEFRLMFCESLASIPDCMRRLTSLQRLEVRDCPKLLRRCDKETGEDWHKIAHIPNVELKEAKMLSHSILSQMASLWCVL